MPPPQSSRRRSLMALRAALLGATVAAGCAAHHAPVETDPPEVLVEVLPRSADVFVDGAPVGPGPRTIAIPDPTRWYTFRASAPGFEPAERTEAGAHLAGTRIGLALRPVGSRTSVDLDDPATLQGAALMLLRDGRPALALEYAQRAIDAAPRAAVLHELAAEASAAAGDGNRAIAEYRAYLTLAPDAVDRDEVADRIEALHATTGAPGVEVRRDAPAGGGTR